MSDPTSGRPRDARIDAAVLTATRELLVEVGYQELSLKGIAERAGVSRPALYRRWPSKAQVVHDALFPSDVTIASSADGRFEDDLRQLIGRMVASYARPEAQQGVPGLLTELHDRELRRQVIDGLQDRARAELADRVARAVAAGELRATTDADVLLDVVVGAVLQRVIARQLPDPTFADQLTELLLDGLRPR